MATVVIVVVPLCVVWGSAQTREYREGKELARKESLLRWEEAVGQQGDHWTGPFGSRNGKSVKMVVFQDYFTVASDDFEDLSRQDMLDIISKHGPPRW